MTFICNLLYPVAQLGGGNRSKVPRVANFASDKIFFQRMNEYLFSFSENENKRFFVPKGGNLLGRSSPAQKF